MFLILTHDVDWPRGGPGISHILARRERFDAGVVKKVIEEGFNPYYGVPSIIEIEERLGVRSTFFFRPQYDDGSVHDYEDTIRELIINGFEIGLHINDPSSIEKIAAEKAAVEHVSDVTIHGSRIHNLRVNADSFRNMAGAGLKYDSSLVHSKGRVDPKDAGFEFFDDVCVFPITFMDAYLFTYMNLTEEKIVDFLLNAIDRLASLGIDFVTLLWHDNSIMMKGGRIYPTLLAHLVSRRNLTIVRAIDAFKLVQNQTFKQSKE